VSVCPGSYAGLSQRWLWDYCTMYICSPIGLPDVSQAGLVPESVSIGALLFSQCNVARRSFVQSGGSRYLSFDFSWCLFSAKCGSSISARYLICGAHAVCLCTLVAILDPPLLYILTFFIGTGVCTHVLSLCGQVFYHLSLP
jgi:hypothetical protein